MSGVCCNDFFSSREDWSCREKFMVDEALANDSLWLHPQSLLLNGLHTGGEKISESHYTNIQMRKSCLNPTSKQFRIVSDLSFVGECNQCCQLCWKITIWKLPLVLCRCIRNGWAFEMVERDNVVHDWGCPGFQPYVLGIPRYYITVDETGWHMNVNQPINELHHYLETADEQW